MLPLIISRDVITRDGLASVNQKGYLPSQRLLTITDMSETHIPTCTYLPTTYTLFLGQTASTISSL